MQVFCDLDGVLADFDTHYENLFGIRPDKYAPAGDPRDVDWKLVQSVGNFYLTMPIMQDAMELWGYLTFQGLYPIILTGVPKSVNAADNHKRDWVKKHLGASVGVVCTQSKNKYKYCLDDGDLLIDDWTKYQGRWLNAGGRWITHTSAQDTIRQLKELGL